MTVRSGGMLAMMFVSIMATTAVAQEMLAEYKQLGKGGATATGK